MEAFFTTDLTLSLEAILAQYRERWAVEITIRDSNAFAGFGQDQCRKRERVVGANTLRLVLAAARTLWFVEHTARDTGARAGALSPLVPPESAPPVNSTLSGPAAKRLQAAGVFPIPRFTPALAEIHAEARKCFTFSSVGRETNA